MKKKTNPQERRQYPRIDKQLPFRVAANGYDFVTSTQNVSCVGAYCRINKYIPPFTKVMVKLNLPVSSSARDEHSQVECKGVVVRTEDESAGGFNIAIFFNEINDSQRNKISQYLHQFLPQKSPVS
jgi:hypothetical protein